MNETTMLAHRISNSSYSPAFKYQDKEVNAPIY